MNRARRTNRAVTNLSVVALLMVGASACLSSPTVEQTSAGATSAPITDEPATPTTPPIDEQPTTAAEPAEVPTETPVISPEAPLPLPRLCTNDVDLGEELNLRTAPALDAPIVFGIPGGSCRMSAVADAADGWVEVTYSTQTANLRGFVSTDFAVEDDERTIALRWFDRVVAEQDATELAYQPWVDISISEYGFPPAAHRAVPFAGGPSDAGDCAFIGDVTLGCPVLVLDSAGELVTPMVITVAAIGNNDYDAGFFPDDFGDQSQVTGFIVCPISENCADIGFSFVEQGRMEVGGDPNLAGVAIGAPAADAIAELTTRFGPPVSDSGWIVGCPLDGQDNVNERYLDWGSLSAGFRRGDSGLTDDTTARFDHWFYRLDADRTFDPAGPTPDEVALPAGTTLGMNITEANRVLGAEQFENEVLQVQQLNADNWTMYSNDLASDSRINAVGVPYIPLCD